MYAEDAPRISEWAHDRPENLRDLITFVLLTIRVPFQRVEASMIDVRKQGANSAFLWGWKRPGFEYVRDNAAELHADLFDADTITAIDILATRVPGLGIVKGAFVVQMLGHEVACMDTRNLVELGYEGRYMRTDGVFAKLRPATRQRKIVDYVQTTIASGGAAHWWDHWCSGIAPGLAMTPNEVSRLHWTIPTGNRR